MPTDFVPTPVNNTSSPQLISDAVVMEALTALMSADDVSGVVGSVLSMIGQALKAERIRLFILDRERTVIETTNEWRADSVDSLIETWRTLSVDQIPWTMNQLWSTNPVQIADISTFNSSEKDKDWWQRQKIKSCVVLPLPVRRSLGGFLQIDGVKELNGVDMVAIQKILGALGSQLSRKGSSIGSGVDAEGKYQTIFESVDDGIISVSKNGVIEDVNLKICQLLGKEKDFFQGKYLKDLVTLFPEGSLNNILRNLGYSKMMGMKVPPGEIRFSMPNGEEKELEISATALNAKGSVTGSLVVIRDITFRKGMEAAVQDSEMRLRRVLDAVKEGITLSDESGNFLIFNPEMQELTGYSKQEANASPDFLGLLHPEASQKEQIVDYLQNFKVGDRNSSETQITSKNGDKKDLLVSTTVIGSDNQRLFLSAYHDVTQMKAFQKQLEQRNNELEDTTKELNETAEALKQARDHLEEKVVEKTKELRSKVDEIENLAKFPSEDPFPVLRVNSEGRLLYANQASKDLLEVWETSEGNKIPEGWVKVVGEVFITNSRKIMEVEFANQFLSFVLVPVKKAGYVNLYGRDVSKEKEVDRMKNEFIAMVSHQIRTPLTSLRWYSELLLKDDLSESQVDMADTIHETAVNLATLVNDLLSISRLESGRLDSMPIKANIVSLVQEVHKSFAAQAGSKKQNYILEADESIPEFTFDPKLMREVFSNLISNAIKYTPDQGTVTVTLHLQEEKVIAQVKDSGIGIPKEDQENIFSRFYRAQNAVDTEAEGTGLGLSVAKMMVEKCGGSISFESQESKGTTFTISLPIGLV